MNLLRPSDRLISIGTPGLTFLSRPAAAAGGITGWWTIAGQTCVAAYQPVGAADIAASYVNLANPGTYNAADGVAPTFATATGWTFNGSTQYLTTGIVHNASNMHSVVVRVSDTGTNSGAAIGLDTGARFRIYPRYSNTLYYSYKSTDEPANTAGAGVVSGVIALTQDAIYVDGASREAVVSSASATDLVIAIGTDGANRYAGKVQAVAIYSTTLSAAEVAALTTRMAALA